eukprot:SAG31_NODE_1866_length_7025_cov_2.554017_3_plen_151_part_00
MILTVDTMSFERVLDQWSNGIFTTVRTAGCTQRETNLLQKASSCICVWDHRCSTLVAPSLVQLSEGCSKPLHSHRRKPRENKVGTKTLLTCTLLTCTLTELSEGSTVLSSWLGSPSVAEIVGMTTMAEIEMDNYTSLFATRVDQARQKDQ